MIRALFAMILTVGAFASGAVERRIANFQLSANSENPYTSNYSLRRQVRQQIRTEAQRECAGTSQVARILSQRLLSENFWDNIQCPSQEGDPDGVIRFDCEESERIKTGRGLSSTVEVAYTCEGTAPQAEVESQHYWLLSGLFDSLAEDYIFVIGHGAGCGSYNHFVASSAGCVIQDEWNSTCKVKLEYTSDNHCEAAMNSVVKFSRERIQELFPEATWERFGGPNLEFVDKNGKSVARMGMMGEMEIVRDEE